jgi:hypothetical protein
MSTALSKTLAKTGEATAATRLISSLSGKLPTRGVHVPCWDQKVWLRLLGAEEENAMEGRALAALKRHGLEDSPDAVERTQMYHLLAEAVITEDRIGAPAFGTVEEWGTVPLFIQEVLVAEYLSLRAEVNPHLMDLTEQDLSDIKEAIAKKNSTLLVRLGARRLTSYLLISAAPPTSSPTEKSTPGGSSPESSKETESSTTATQ